MRGLGRIVVTSASAALLALAADVATGCGRNHLGQGDGAALLSADAGLADVGADVVNAGSEEVGVPSLRDASTYLDGPAYLPREDVPPTVDVPTAGPEVATFSCASFAPLVAKGVLSSRHAKQVRFAPDGKALLLILAGDGSTGDEVWVVSLPDGQQHQLGTGIKSADWFGPSTVLATTVDADSFILPNPASRGSDIVSPIAHKVCGQATSPDGSRLYFVRDCTDSVGDLYVMDLAEGFPKRFATSVSASGLVVSPGGRWAAYVVYAADASPSTTKVRVVGKDGVPYEVPISDWPNNPYFVSDDLLLVESPGSTYDSPNIWSYRPGSTDATLLTSGYHGFDGYVWNADRSAFLVAKFSAPPVSTADLYVTDVGSGSSVRLATDLIDHRMFEMRVRSFAIAPTTGRVVYIADAQSDGGRVYGVASVSQRGEDRSWLASNVGTVVVSPFGDRVAVLMTDRTSAPSTARVTVLSPTTGSVQFTEQSSSISAVTFVPGDRGLVFTDSEGDVKTSRLRYLSFATGAITLLASWSSNLLTPYGEPLGVETDTYPMDGNGCFVPVDSDLAPSGTRLVLLPE
jgi:hypothetical protein